MIIYPLLHLYIDESFPTLSHPCACTDSGFDCSTEPLAMNRIYTYMYRYTKEHTSHILHHYYYRYVFSIFFLRPPPLLFLHLHLFQQLFQQLLSSLRYRVLCSFTGTRLYRVTRKRHQNDATRRDARIYWQPKLSRLYIYVNTHRCARARHRCGREPRLLPLLDSCISRARVRLHAQLRTPARRTHTDDGTCARPVIPHAAAAYANSGGATARSTRARPSILP